MNQIGHWGVSKWCEPMAPVPARADLARAIGRLPPSAPDLPQPRPPQEFHCMATEVKSSPRGTARKQARTPAKRITIKRTNLGPMGKLEDFLPHKLAVVANRVSQSIGRL